MAAQFGLIQLARHFPCSANNVFLRNFGQARHAEEEESGVRLQYVLNI
jgi:hypothetical protein